MITKQYETGSNNVIEVLHRAIKHIGRERAIPR